MEAGASRANGEAGQKRDSAFYDALKARAGEIREKYLKVTPQSRELMERAKSVFPGGYTRDSLLRKPYPTFIVSGSGETVLSADGRQIFDFWFNATSLVHGHRHPAIDWAIRDQLDLGTAFYGPGQVEIEHAERLLGRVVGADKIRYANSGSEAVMMALRIARAFTGRSVVGKFEGAYHGIYDDVSWSVGPQLKDMGLAGDPVGVPDSAGLPAADGRTVVLPFNDISAAVALIERHANNLAAVLVEPFANRIGMIMPEPEFLQALGQVCSAHGVLLIFDEVVSFRNGYRGAAGTLGITPDLTTLGKLIGGGFPVGAVAGRGDLLDVTSNERPSRVVHAGTFNANPVTMAAGLAALDALTPDAVDRMTALGERARQALREVCAGLPLQVTGGGSMFKITAVANPIRSYRDAVLADSEWEAHASLQLLNEGVLVTPKLQGCVSSVTTPEAVDRLVEAFRGIVKL